MTDSIDVKIGGRVVSVPGSTADAQRLGLIPPAASDPEVVVPDGLPSDAWTNKQIDAWAEREGHDLSAATSKAERLSIIAGA